MDEVGDDGGGGPTTLASGKSWWSNRLFLLQDSWEKSDRIRLLSAGILDSKKSAIWCLVVDEVGDDGRGGARYAREAVHVDVPVPSL